MLTYKVDDMTCGRCAGRITAAVRAIDPTADVRIDLGRHEVGVRTAADAGDIEASIRDAGYTPVAMAHSAETTPSAARTGCCCSGGARRQA